MNYYFKVVIYEARSNAQVPYHIYVYSNSIGLIINLDGVIYTGYASCFGVDSANSVQPNRAIVTIN